MVINLTESFQVLIEDVHVGVHAHRQCGCGHAGHTGAQNHHVGCRYARYASDQHPSATTSAHEVMRSHKGGHTTSNFAHRRQEWQGVIGKSDGLVGNGYVAGVNESIGTGTTRGEVEIGEEDLVLPGLQAMKLGLHGLFHLQNKVGLGPDVISVVEELGPRRDVVGVAD